MIEVCCSYFSDGFAISLYEYFKFFEIPFHGWALDFIPEELSSVTRGYGKLKKFQVYNNLVKFLNKKTEIVIFIDDDVLLHREFIPGFVYIVKKEGFALAQPALTHNSHYSHKITLQSPFCEARETNFVEIGPCFAMTKEFLNTQFPFPSTMGHGLDYCWSNFAAKHNYKLGIVDKYPIVHNHRGIGNKYSQAEALIDMNYVFAMNPGYATIPQLKILRYILDEHKNM